MSIKKKVANTEKFKTVKADEYVSTFILDNGQYYLHGVEDEPAIKFFDGSRDEWWDSGRRHRVDKPAVISNDGEFWFFEGSLHRTDGPAITLYLDSPEIKNFINPDNSTITPTERQLFLDLISQHQNNLHIPYLKFYYIHGKKHREDGPAVEYLDGRIEFWHEGKLSRNPIYGCAVESNNPHENGYFDDCYYVDGVLMSKDDILKIKATKLLEIE